MPPPSPISTTRVLGSRTSASSALFAPDEANPEGSAHPAVTTISKRTPRCDGRSNLEPMALRPGIEPGFLSEGWRRGVPTGGKHGSRRVIGVRRCERDRRRGGVGPGRRLGRRKDLRACRAQRSEQPGTEPDLSPPLDAGTARGGESHPCDPPVGGARYTPVHRVFLMWKRRSEAQ